MPLEFHSAEITFHTAIDARRCRHGHTIGMFGAGHKLSPPRGKLGVGRGSWLVIRGSFSHRNYPKCSASPCTGRIRERHSNPRRSDRPRNPCPPDPASDRQERPISARWLKAPLSFLIYDLLLIIVPVLTIVVRRSWLVFRQQLTGEMTK